MHVPIPLFMYLIMDRINKLGCGYGFDILVQLETLQSIDK